MGEPRGRWEGNTLVVETINFNPKMSFRGSNPDTMRLVERFTPTGPNAIEWRVTVEDPIASRGARSSRVWLCLEPYEVESRRGSAT